MTQCCQKTALEQEKSESCIEEKYKHPILLIEIMPLLQFWYFEKVIVESQDIMAEERQQYWNKVSKHYNS